MGSAEALYAGPELKLAAGRSAVGSPLRGFWQGSANAAAILADIAGRRLARRAATRFEWLVARGNDPATREPLTVAYAGDGASRGWCLETAFPDYDTVADVQDIAATEVGQLSGESDADIVFTENIPPPLLIGQEEPLLELPAWVKQRVRVLGRWHEQIDGLRRETRQETGRILRKYRYRCELSRRASDCESFYDRLYLPYIKHRFGASAAIVERATFLRQCRKGALLRLLSDDRVLGAALLRPVGRTMAVVWSALDPAYQARELRGATDALDYFSLLYAHLRRCRWLDLGPSRPDLDDGVLRYKAKWGAELNPGLAAQSMIRLYVRGNVEAAGAFLGRQSFLARDNQGLYAVLAVDGRSGAAELEARLAEVRAPGIRHYRVIACPSAGPALRRAVAALGPTVALRDLQRQ